MGGSHADEKPAIKAGVPRLQRQVTRVGMGGVWGTGFLFGLQ